jgi:hypothetical protein
MSATVTAEVRQLSADELARLYCAGDLDVPDLLAIDRADLSARKASDKRQSERSAWYDAAYAQYLAADAACNGYLLSDLGKREGIGQEMALWTGSDAWAERRASEELREFWYLNGGRLSLANYRRQQAIAACAYRDERDLEKEANHAVSPAHRHLSPGTGTHPGNASTRAVLPVARVQHDSARAHHLPVAPRPAGSIARMITALGALERQAGRTAARIDALADHLRRDAA